MRMARFIVYKSTKDGMWRWRFTAINGKIIAVSSEGYTHKRSCLNALHLVKHEALGAPVYDKNGNRLDTPPLTAADVLAAST